MWGAGLSTPGESQGRVLRAHPAVDDADGMVVLSGDPSTDGGRVDHAVVRLTVRGAVAESVLTLISERFTTVSSASGAGPSTVVTVIGIDQAGERALLALLWDTGHEIASFDSSSVSTSGRPPDA